MEGLAFIFSCRLRGALLACAFWAAILLTCLGPGVSRASDRDAGPSGPGATPHGETAMPWGGTPSRKQAFERAAAITALGRTLFVDANLSASGRISCASCHDPAHGFSPANDLAVQIGGSGFDQPGRRATPGLTYSQFSPFFTEHYFESDEGQDESVDNGPTGGLTWDGRVNRGRQQARLPLFSPDEMANTGIDAIVDRVQHSPYTDALRAIWGAGVLANPTELFDAITQALEYFEHDAATFSPFSSKYDAYLRGEATLTDQEARGLALFESPAKGNCARCHRSKPTADGAPPLFTDFGFVGLGLPRNAAIPANSDPSYFDLGLCGPKRKDFADRTEYCGLFKTPSLRNVALRHSLFHNGAIHSLTEAVAFYVERDTKPEKWYQVGPNGHVRKFDDLPAATVSNIDHEPPFGGKPGDEPALSPAEIADITAFLKTLTDGYAPGQQSVHAATDQNLGIAGAVTMRPRTGVVDSVLPDAH